MQRWLLRLAGLLFLLIAAAHVARFILHIDIVIGHWAVPMWASPVAVVVLLLLAWLYFRVSRS
ncbi:MAG: hypothetical protein R8L58_00505 [Mariprofundaceae bacterium]